MRSMMLTVMVVGMLSLTGCLGAFNMMQPGVLVAGPGLIFTDVHGGTLILDNGTAPTKTGQACSSEVLGLVATGDSRVETAMANGNIQKVVFVDHSIKSYVFGIYGEACTRVRGN